MIDLDLLRRELSETATEVGTVDLRERALATSHRIRIRRTAATTVAGLAVVALALGTAVAIRDDRSPAPPAVTPSPTLLPTEPPDSQPDLGPFESGTITVPSWGSVPIADCSAGRMTLRNGQEPDDVHRPVNIRSYIVVDVDQDGTEDYVAHMTCGEGPEAGGSQVVAFRLDGKELRPIGRIVGTQDGFGMMDYLEVRDGGRVAVLVAKEYTDGGEDSVPNQWRTYAWRQGKFQQVDGPTTFPAKPPAARLSIVPSTLAFRPAGKGFSGQMTVTVRNDGDIDVARLEFKLILPGQVQPAGGDWAGCTVPAESDPDDDATVLVCAVAGPRARSQVSIPYTFVATEKPVPVEDEIGLSNHYVQTRQLPPFGGQVLINDFDAEIPISLP
ncbi:hypothetical protein [Actinoplanes regularis]|uniref:Uncharacterized protein n=1 Tax=Actinoplanes regularis TaxID=52697 RepID=A0A239F1N0_9ACTN|nr:hypothetical protein [Actinoplanes regularis]GIE89922.1 hypothetical protein Are01nite_64020 [Actinoplanes regularis]SNS50745.1 hypothetical protein SAMN06264365_11733 [Actinoplanes regularis]